MVFNDGIVEMHYGGSLSSDPQDPNVSYVCGTIEEFCMGIDEASYSEVKYHVKNKGFVEYCFMIYFKHPDRGLVRLYDDNSSRDFSGILKLFGRVVVYVQHGAGINHNFISVGLSSKIDVHVFEQNRNRVVDGGSIDRVVDGGSMDRVVEDNEHNEDIEVESVVVDDLCDDHSSSSSDEEATHEEEN
ncbi:hypothetical protein ACFE04_007518 [Oxalis oulophora]